MSYEFEFFHKLPAPPKPRSVLAEFAEALRDRPRVWGKWPVELAPGSARVVPSRVNSGKYRTLPSDRFHAVSRGGVVYVRYIGPRGRAPVDTDIDETADECEGVPVRTDTQPDPRRGIDRELGVR
ncbi:hypothetical protein [Nocardia sp. SC052]|uniref:hypothetical protein n=1 Tax=Nocardia sichangensis TaxID=3385975 RepID=UPI0039A04B56